MGKLLKMRPKMVWPWGSVFRVQDDQNPDRGEWYFRDDWYGDIHGPYRHHSQAQLALDLMRSNPPSRA